MSRILEVSGLSKHMGGSMALDGCSFSLESGRIVGLLGPNGAGKSTLLKTLAGVLRPDQGTVTLRGEPVTRRLRPRIAYMADHSLLPGEMKVETAVKWYRDLFPGASEPRLRQVAGGLPWDRKVSELSKGQAADARRTSETLRARFEAQGLTRFLPNMDAMLCRVALHCDDQDSADEWYRTKAPRDPMHLNVMKRYQYLTQAMVEIAQNRPDAALLTLSPLERYIQGCGRHIDGIHLNILCALALHRKKDDAWRARLTAALDTAAEYSFITPVSVYSAAVLPLLEKLNRNDDTKWYKRLMAAVRTQATYYPHFLAPRMAAAEELTPTELQILHLICADKSNAEIAQIMNIKLPTVKTHVSHVLEKLDVKRRSEAKTAAKKLWLISNH